MKEWATSIIGVAFAIAVIVFFGTGKIPLDVFGPIAMAAILWFFRERQVMDLLAKIDKIDKHE